MAIAFTKTDVAGSLLTRPLLLVVALVLAFLPGQASAQKVGVIPASPGACPRYTEYVSIFMDNEDDSPISSLSGWTGAITMDSNRNTRFGFCRVEGNQFRNHPATDYAVLSLDTACPAGSVRISRLFDNEDSNSTSTYSGSIYPNVSNGDTTLYFCVFRASGTTPPSVFPNLHAPYGVFAGPIPAFPEGGSLGTGLVLTDDEDSNNMDDGYVNGIIYGSDAPGYRGRNSYLKVSFVRNDPILNCIYGGVLAGTNCRVQALQTTQVLQGVSYWVDADPRWPGVYYVKVSGGCPYGGAVAGPNCRAVTLPQGVVVQGAHYWVDADPRWPGIYYAN